MKTRVVFAAIATMAVLSTGPAVFAAPSAALRIPVQASFSKTKMISFNVRNDSGAAVKLKAGDQEMTVSPGKIVALKLAQGASVIAQEATASYAAGTVLAVAQPELRDATVVLH